MKARQYHPGFFDGFDKWEIEVQTLEELYEREELKVFMHEGFTRFEYVPDMHMVFAHYENGEQWGVCNVREYEA